MHENRRLIWAMYKHRRRAGVEHLARRLLIGVLVDAPPWLRYGWVGRIAAKWHDTGFRIGLDCRLIVA